MNHPGRATLMHPFSRRSSPRRCPRPMRKRPLHHAFVLAAVLLVGGVAAPTVHRAEHARHTAEVRAALHGSHGHVHAAPGADAFSAALAGVIQHDVVCVLCAGWTTSTLAAAGVVGPDRLLVGLLADPAAARTPSRLRERAIRGPPARA